jgi:hypothetical protein
MRPSARDSAISALDNAIEPLQGLRDLLARLDLEEPISGALTGVAETCAQAAISHIAEAMHSVTDG